MAGALTLFFGGVATLFDKQRVTMAVHSLAGLTLALGAVNLVRAF